MSAYSKPKPQEIRFERGVTGCGWYVYFDDELFGYALNSEQLRHFFDVAVEASDRHYTNQQHFAALLERCAANPRGA